MTDCAPCRSLRPVEQGKILPIKADVGLSFPLNTTIEDRARSLILHMLALPGYCPSWLLPVWRGCGGLHQIALHRNWMLFLAKIFPILPPVIPTRDWPVLHVFPRI
jgi:hypothetical protein